jgi:hypothetical protein
MSAFATISDALEADWQSIARPEQLPPPGRWTVWMYLGGRGLVWALSDLVVGPAPQPLKFVPIFAPSQPRSFPGARDDFGSMNFDNKQSFSSGGFGC